jgi:TP901 family phage tail tape measure protein
VTVDVKLGRAVLDLVTDPAKLRAGLSAAREETLTTLQSAQKALLAAGSSMTQTGYQMTRGVTLPVLAAGKAIYDVSADFQSSMAQIVGLVGIGRDQVNAWRPEIERIGETTGKGPGELAKALYFVTSAGIPASRAMEVLEASARAAAAGLGQTEVVADAVTSAINAYEKSGLTAAQATDVLTAAVKYGKAEAASIAPVLGRLLPVASAMNISFSQVAGTLAVMTRTGLDAAEASTSIGAIMSTLLKPSKQAQDALKDVGLSMGDLRAVAAREPDGLVQVMRLLDSRFADNDEQLTKVIPNIRAFRGVMNVLAQDAGGVADVMQGVASATGTTDAAFKAVGDTAQFKVNQSLSRMQGDLLKLGDKVLPLVVKVVGSLADGVASLADWFTKLPPGTQQTIVQMLALAAAVGPILVIVGSLVGALGNVVGAGAALAGFLLKTLVPAIGTALAAAIEGVATLLFSTGIPALESLGVALLGVEAAAGPLLLLLALVAGAVALASANADGLANHLVELRDAGKLTDEQLRDIAHHAGIDYEELVAKMDAIDAAHAAAEKASADKIHSATIDRMTQIDAAQAVLDAQRYAYSHAADAAKEYQEKQKVALDQAYADQLAYTKNALTVLQGFRTDIENAFKAAQDAALDGERTAVEISSKNAELVALDKDYTAHHAKWTAAQIADYKLRRAEILAALAGLKLHAALIGDDMHKEQALTALLTSKDMKDGLTSKMPETAAAYGVLRDEIITKLEELAKKGGPTALAATEALAKYLDPNDPRSPLNDAPAWGTAVGTEYADKLAAALNNKRYLVRNALAGYQKLLLAASPPGPESPLHFIDVWASRTGDAWVMPLVASLARGKALIMAPLTDIGRGLASGFTTPSLAMAAAGAGLGTPGGYTSAAPVQAAGGRGTTKNYNLTVQGDLVARDKEDVLTTLQRMDAISKDEPDAS